MNELPCTCLIHYLVSILAIVLVGDWRFLQNPGEGEREGEWMEQSNKVGRKVRQNIYWLEKCNISNSSSGQFSRKKNSWQNRVGLVTTVKPGFGQNNALVSHTILAKGRSKEMNDFIYGNLWELFNTWIMWFFIVWRLEICQKFDLNKR